MLVAEALQVRQDFPHNWLTSVPDNPGIVFAIGKTKSRHAVKRDG